MKTLLGVYIFIMGTIFASFFGVIIDRVPKGLSIISPASRCDNCGHVLKWYENIPIISYLILGGKCSSCKTKIGLFSFIYEIVGGLSLLFIFLKYGLSIETLLIELIVLVLLLIAGYDYKTGLVLDACLVTLFILCLGLLAYRVFILKVDFKQYIFSVIMAVIFVLLVRFVMTKILKKESMGLGDVYLIGIMGLIFKPFELLLGILVSSFVGSIISIVNIKLNKNSRDDEIPFCPYLCFGFYIMFIYGEFLTNLLLR